MSGTGDRRGNLKDEDGICRRLSKPFKNKAPLFVAYRELICISRTLSYEPTMTLIWYQKLAKTNRLTDPLALLSPLGDQSIGN